MTPIFSNIQAVSDNIPALALELLDNGFSIQVRDTLTANFNPNREPTEETHRVIEINDTHHCKTSEQMRERINYISNILSFKLKKNFKEYCLELRESLTDGTHMIFVIVKMRTSYDADKHTIYNDIAGCELEVTERPTVFKDYSCKIPKG